MEPIIPLFDLVAADVFDDTHRATGRTEQDALTFVVDETGTVRGTRPQNECATLTALGSHLFEVGLHPLVVCHTVHRSSSK